LVADLVIRARDGDSQAWDALVDRYLPLVWSICRRHALDRGDAAHVCQTVWLRLADQLSRLRDPAAVPDWLVTTTQRECARLRRARKPASGQALDPESSPAATAAAAGHELFLAERRAALRDAFTRLPAQCQQLITMLSDDPPVAHTEISGRLGIPVESIEPACRRCLDRLRHDPALTALTNAETGNGGAKEHGLAVIGHGHHIPQRRTA
jgi:RNA polymerase sigma factor (sigma-70 family)